MQLNAPSTLQVATRQSSARHVMHILLIATTKTSIKIAPLLEDELPDPPLALTSVYLLLLRVTLRLHFGSTIYGTKFDAGMFSFQISAQLSSRPS